MLAPSAAKISTLAGSSYLTPLLTPTSYTGSYAGPSLSDLPSTNSSIALEHAPHAELAQLQPPELPKPWSDIERYVAVECWKRMIFEHLLGIVRIGQVGWILTYVSAEIGRTILGYRQSPSSFFETDVMVVCVVGGGILAVSSYILLLTLFKVGVARTQNDEFYEEEVTWGCSTLEQAAIIWGIPLAVVVTILFGQALGLVVMRRWLEEWSAILQDVSVKRALTSSATGLPITIVASITVYQFVDFFKS